MQFLNPWLLAGLAGIAAPIAIHLMNRFRHRDVDWAAMDLLRKVLVVRSRRIRLEDLLLLLLRCLIVSLLALAIARPVLTPDGGATRADVGVVIALDASFSMAHKPGVYARFDQAVERVEEILATLKPGDPVTFVLLGERPRVLFRNSGYEVDRLAAILEKTKPFPERLNLDLCLSEIEKLVGEIKAPVRECYLVTDAQEVTWGQLSEPSRASLERIALEGRIFYLPVAGGQSENLAVTGFHQSSGMVRQGALARYIVDVSNSGQEPRQKVPITLYNGDEVIDQRIVNEIGPGKTESLPMFVRFNKEGPLRLTARIGDDELMTDNSRFTVVNVRSQVRVLCVEGTPAKGSESETYFLLSALAPRRSQGDAEKAPIVIDQVGWLDLSSRRLSDYDVVMLVDVPELLEAQVTAIGQFVSGGGGLITFLGPNIQPDLLNQNMNFEGGSLLPGTLLEAIGDASDRSVGQAINPIDGHPLAFGLAGLSQEVLNEPRIFRHFPLELSSNSRVVVAIVGGPQDILVAEKSLGRGKVVLFTSSANRDWTDMVVHPTYPILLHETIAYLGRQDFERPLLVGSPLVLPLPLPMNAAIPDNVICLAPGDHKLPVKPVRRQGQVIADFGPTEYNGFYDVQYAVDASIPVAVSVDPGESHALCLTDSALDETLQGTGLKIVPQADDLGAAIRQGRIGHEIWRELMLAGLLLLLIEAYLSRRFTRGATSPNRSQSMTGLKDVSTRGANLT
jgi:hypothetical protein